MKYTFRGSKYITEEQLLIAKKNGIESEVLRARVKNGWDIKRATTEKVENKVMKIDWENIILACFKGDNFIVSGTISEIAEYLGVGLATCKKYYHVTKEVKPGSDKKKLYIVDKRLKTGEEIRKVIEENKIMPSFDKWVVDIYALYKGEKLLADGNVFEIAEQTGQKVKTLKHLTYEIVKKRNKGDALSMVYLYTEGEEDE